MTRQSSKFTRKKKKPTAYQVCQQCGKKKYCKHTMAAKPTSWVCYNRLSANGSNGHATSNDEDDLSFQGSNQQLQGDSQPKPALSPRTPNPAYRPSGKRRVSGTPQTAPSKMPKIVRGMITLSVDLLTELIRHKGCLRCRHHRCNGLVTVDVKVICAGSGYRALSGVCCARGCPLAKKPQFFGLSPTIKVPNSRRVLSIDTIQVALNTLLSGIFPTTALSLTQCYLKVPAGAKHCDTCSAVNPQTDVDSR
eukprot:TRINITY_DN12564_c0_g1_i12.p2 TRINITY_DN12564_c0_g1~~TRINITY_DN12564_c0_g1_i12.p2  ORF type:complete len:250 (+),score=3.10 TRINITY_DN12564_c0_g1_i12:3595-4344(+)